MTKYIFVNTSASYDVPLLVFRGAEPQRGKSIIILPALGVSAKFYTSFARELSKQGVDAVIMEQRGHGASSLRASRETDYGFREWLTEDIHATFNWVADNFDTEISLLGHSLGGHVAACYVGANPGAVKSLVLPATGTPWIKAYSGLMKFKLSVLYLLLPIATKLSGYYNGRLFGFGDKEAATLIFDWHNLIGNNRYQAAGIELDFDRLIGEYEGRLLSLRFDQDELAPEAAVEAVNMKFKRAKIKREVISKRQLEISANHFNWAKKPEYCADLIVNWLTSSD